MKWSFASVGLIMLGLFGIVIIMLFNDITVSNEQDYYTLKYATEASMLEAIDEAYYRATGDLKISKEKFVENFTRRFTETSTFGQGNYDIVFYQINETPPKVSLRIYDKTSGYNIYTYTSDVETTQVNIVNELSAILEGTEIDKDKNGYEITDSSSWYTGGVDVSDDTCTLSILVGRDNRTGEDIYRCMHSDGSNDYRSINGKVVSENNVSFDTITRAKLEDSCDGIISNVGTIYGKGNKYAYECIYKNGRSKYMNEYGKQVSREQIQFFSKNTN